MSTKEKAMSHIIKSIFICALLLGISACDEQAASSENNVDTNIQNTTQNNLDIDAALNAGGGQIYSAVVPALNKDADGDGLVDSNDPDPKNETLFAESMGDSAFVLESVHSIDNGHELANTLLQNATVQLTVTGSDFYQGTAWVVFETATGYKAERPEVVSLSQWKIKVPEQYGDVHGLHLVKGNYRTNSIQTVFLLATSSLLYPYDAQVVSGEAVVLQGKNLLKVDKVILGGQELNVIEQMENTIKVTMPASSMGNKLTVVSNRNNSNEQFLDFVTEIEVSIDAAIVSNINNTYRSYHNGQTVNLASDDSVTLIVPAYRPIVMYWDVIAGDGQRQPGMISSLVYPEQSQLKIGVENSLLAEVYNLRDYTAFATVQSWADAWAQLLATLELDEAKSYMSGLQDQLLNQASFEKQALLKALLSKINPSLFTQSTSPVTAARFIDTINGNLDEIIPVVVSHRAIAGRESYSGFSVYGCGLSTLQPPGLWPSDLCITNSTKVLGSVAAYIAKNTNDRSYKKSDRVTNRHVQNVKDTNGMLGGNSSFLSLFPSEVKLKDKNGKYLCKMNTCFVEILTGGFTKYEGKYPFNQPLTVEEKAVVRKLQARTAMEQFLIPAVTALLGLPDSGNSKECVLKAFISDVSLLTVTEAFADKFNVAATMEDKFLAVNNTYGTYIVNKLKTDPELAAVCLSLFGPASNIIDKIDEQLFKTVGDKAGTYYKVAQLIETAVQAYLTFITPEKIIFQMFPRAQIMSTVPAEIDMLDPLDTVYIHGNQLADNTVPRHPILVMEDHQSKKVEIPLGPSHLKANYSIDYYTNTRHEIPMSELKDSLSQLSSGPVHFNMKLTDRTYEGYPNGDLPVPANRAISLKGIPKITGFSPSAALPADLVFIKGDRFKLFEKDFRVVLQGTDNVWHDVNDPFISDDNEIIFEVPDDLVKGAYKAIVFSSDQDALISAKELVIEEVVSSKVILRDSGPDIDDEITLTFLDVDRNTVLNIDGEQMEYTINANKKSDLQVTSLWSNQLLPTLVNSFRVTCFDTGLNDTCTYELQFTDANVCKAEVDVNNSLKCLDSYSSMKGGQLELYDYASFLLQ